MRQPQGLSGLLSGALRAAAAPAPAVELRVVTRSSCGACGACLLWLGYGFLWPAQWLRRLGWPLPCAVQDWGGTLCESGVHTCERRSCSFLAAPACQQQKITSQWRTWASPELAARRIPADHFYRQGRNTNPTVVLYFISSHVIKDHTLAAYWQSTP